MEWCLENEVKEVAFGDVDGVQRHTSRRKKKKARNRTTNQKLSNWSFGKVYDYLTYKLSAEGITIKKYDESDTTRQCPCCARRKKRLRECIHVCVAINSTAISMVPATFSPKPIMVKSNH